MSWKQLYTLFQDFLLSLLFEKSPLLREIETMNEEAFFARAKPSDIPSALFSYRDPLTRTLVWNIKFRRNKKCCALAGALLYRFLICIPLDRPLLVPVPLSSKRKCERGYNQTEALADEIAKLDADRCFEIEKRAVIRVHAPPQTSLARKERLANLKGAFIVDTSRVKGRDIIILEDVITTGATIAELRRALIKAGAMKVLAIAIAH